MGKQDKAEKEYPAKSSVEYEQQEKARRDAGRYTLGEAAAIIARETGEDVSIWRDKLGCAAFDRALKVYMPGGNVRREYISPASRSVYMHHGVWKLVVKFDYEEAYWYNLNTLLGAQGMPINLNTGMPINKFPEPAALAAKMKTVHVINPSGDTSESLDVFRSMVKLTADEVSIAFVGDKTESGMGANNMLEISARGKTSRVALAALDLVDRRRGELNRQGVILLGMAQKNKLTRTDPIAANMTRLRKVFHEHLGISDDPFYHYQKSAGWEPRFKIDDKRGVADERALREAEHRTDSLEELTERGTQFRDTSENDAAADWLKDNDPDVTA
jgi:hypothetical protein